MISQSDSEKTTAIVANLSKLYGLMRYYEQINLSKSYEVRVESREEQIKLSKASTRFCRRSSDLQFPTSDHFR
ncbi:hypothetical protein NIES2104_36730 [Leptolyngbya sp. NIES-2104]|nr:hypothetical protein NIES2104_36730 [Leptolyngbya sp. NIES-2104]